MLTFICCFFHASPILPSPLYVLLLAAAWRFLDNVSPFLGELQYSRSAQYIRLLSGLFLSETSLD